MEKNNKIENKYVSSIVYLIVIIFIILGLLLSLISYMPFSTLKDKLNYLAPDKHLDNFEPFILIRIRYIGYLILIIGVIFIFAKKKLRNYFCELIISFKQSFRSIKPKLRNLIKEDKVELILLIIITVIAIIIRLFCINQPMRHDEAITFLNFAKKPFLKIVSDYSSSNNHVLHTILVHIFYKILGNKEWVIRLPAFIAGIFIIPTSYFAAKAFYNKFAALIACGLIASSSALVEYSTNARGYTILTLLFLLTLILAKYIKDNNNKAAILIFAILTALGFYTLPMFLYPAGIVFIWLILSTILNDTKIGKKLLSKNILIAFTYIILITFILYIPIFIFTTTESGIVKDAIKSQTFIEYFKNLPLWLKSTWNSWNRDIPIAIIIILIIGFISSIILNKKLKAPKVPAILAAIIWLIPILLIQRPTMYERLWLFLLPLYLIISSSGIEYLLSIIIKKQFVYRIIIIFIVLSLTVGLGINIIKNKSVYYSKETGTLRDAENITIFLEDFLQPKDRIILGCPSEWPLPYYFDRYNISTSYFSNDLNKANRAFIIINTENDQNLDYCLNWSNLKLDNFSEIKLLKKYETAEIYVTYRKVYYFISSFFYNFLDREPSTEELTYWVNLLINKEKTFLDFGENIILNEEFNNKKISNSDFIILVYKTLLNREPDKKGYVFWLNSLENGMSFEHLFEKIVKSPEFKRICESYKIEPYK